MTDDPTSNALPFLTEWVRQLDTDTGAATGRTVGTELGLDRAESERVMKQLRRRDLIVQIDGPSRSGDGLSDWRFEVTPAGLQAAASGRLPG